jgi:hypothetical protein
MRMVPHIKVGFVEALSSWSTQSLCQYARSHNSKTAGPVGGAHRERDFFQHGDLKDKVPKVLIALSLLP